MAAPTRVIELLLPLPLPARQTVRMPGAGPGIRLAALLNGQYRCECGSGSGRIHPAALAVPHHAQQTVAPMALSSSGRRTSHADSGSSSYGHPHVTFLWPPLHSRNFPGPPRGVIHDTQTQPPRARAGVGFACSADPTCLAYQPSATAA